MLKAFPVWHEIVIEEDAVPTMEVSHTSTLPWYHTSMRSCGLRMQGSR